MLKTISVDGVPRKPLVLLLIVLILVILIYSDGDKNAGFLATDHANFSKKFYNNCFFKS